MKNQKKLKEHFPQRLFQIELKYQWHRRDLISKLKFLLKTLLKSSKKLEADNSTF